MSGGFPLTSGALQSLIQMVGISSIFEAFRDRVSTLTIPHTIAATKTTKVRSVPLPKPVREAALAAALVDAATTGVVVDLGEQKKTPSSYGAVFTTVPDNGPCWHCRREVKPEFKVGIPLRIRDDRFHHLLIVDIEGRACNFKCAFKFAKDHISEHSCFEGRITAMQQINEICNPGTKLIAAPDWRLLKINGGSLTDEEFDGEVKAFVPTSNLQFRLCNLTFSSS